MKKSLTKLRPGGKIKISFSSLSGLREDTWDLTSRIGYYNEFCVAYDNGVSM